MPVASSQQTFARERALVGEIEQHLARAIDLAALAPNLREAVRYAALAGGKRLRPLLTLLSAEAAGGRREDAMDAAAALECVHAFSLVHDDLPALDNDALRRGQPTVHVKFGEAMAILAGDALLSIAFECAARTPRHPGRIVAEVAAATTSMITGQVYDTLGGLDPKLAAAAKLHQIHRNKTGALIRAACRVGAVAVGAPDAVEDALTTWGECMGLMFQIVDDMIDETQTAEHAGKAVGKDREAGKLTWPAVHGLEASRAEVARLHQESRRILDPLGSDAAPLREVSDFLATRTR